MDSSDCKNSNIHINQFVNNYKISISKLKKIASLILYALGLHDMCVSISFVHPLTMRSFNKKYKGKNKSTDVLSFPLQIWNSPLLVQNIDKKVNKKILLNIKDNEDKLLGDIIISLSDAEKNAKKIGHSLGREVCFLIIHGMLHLVGHTHNTKKTEKIMISQQKKILNFIAKQNVNKPVWENCVQKI